MHIVQLFSYVSKAVVPQTVGNFTFYRFFSNGALVSCIAVLESFYSAKMVCKAVVLQFWRRCVCLQVSFYVAKIVSVVPRTAASQFWRHVHSNSFFQRF